MTRLAFVLGLCALAGLGAAFAEKAVGNFNAALLQGEAAK